MLRWAARRLVENLSISSGAREAQPWAMAYQAPPGYGPPYPAPPKPKSNVVLIIVIVLGFFLVGAIAVAVVSIAGTKRYLQSAKTAEAKSTILSIARAAQSAYEREAMASELELGERPLESHVLCGAATPVPAEVPRGKKTQPGMHDFETGDSKTGWKCLKINMTTPTYFQYDYRVGGNYKGPARGGPDPGKDGFEVSAEGDLDGDGKTSLFTMTGKIDRAKKTVTLDRDIFVSDESE